MEELDKDESLRKSAKALTIASTLLAILTITGAKIQSFNSLIFVLTLENQDGLTQILMLSTLYFAVRYHSNAARYFGILRERWVNAIITDPKTVELIEDHLTIARDSPKVRNLIQDLRNRSIEKPFRDATPDAISYVSYRKYFFNRYIHLMREGEETKDSALIDLKLPKDHREIAELLIREKKYHLLHFFNEKYYMQLISPYLLAVIAIFSFINPEIVTSILNNYLTPNSS